MIALKNRYACLADEADEAVEAKPLHYPFHVKNLAGDLFPCEMTILPHQILEMMDIYATVWKQMPSEWKSMEMISITSLRLSGLNLEGEYEECDEAVIQTVCEGGILVMFLQSSAEYETTWASQRGPRKHESDPKALYQCIHLRGYYSETGKRHPDGYLVDATCVIVEVYIRIPMEEDGPLLYYRPEEMEWSEEGELLDSDDEDIPPFAIRMSVRQCYIKSTGRAYQRIAEMVQEELQGLSRHTESESENWRRIPPGAIQDIIESWEKICQQC